MRACYAENTMHAMWNIIFSFFFLLLAVAAICGLADAGRLVLFIPLSMLLLIALATFRLVRLFTYDHITASLRDRLSIYSEDTFLGTAGRLLTCPWCTGMWFAFVMYVGYAALPIITVPFMYILAIAALASLLQIWANGLGWQAELKKRTVLGPDGGGKHTCG